MAGKTSDWASHTSSSSEHNAKKNITRVRGQFHLLITAILMYRRKKRGKCVCVSEKDER